MEKKKKTEPSGKIRIVGRTTEESKQKMQKWNEFELAIFKPQIFFF